MTMTPTRREFLSSIAVAPALSPILLGMQDKAGAKLPVMGQAPYAFEAVHDWGTLPASLKWGNTHAVVEDAQGFIHIHHTVHATSERQDTMVVFDSQGKFVRSWGPEFRGVAHGLHLNVENGTEFLYLTVNAVNPRMTVVPDIQAAVVKTTLRGEIVWQIDGPPDFAGYRPGADGVVPRYNPTNLAIAANGDIYVADGYGSSFVSQYNSNAEYIRTFGGRGDGVGQLAEPHGIWIDSRGPSPVLVVADRANNRLQRFTLDGQPIDMIGGVKRPCHFHERQGMVVIPDLQGRVTLMNAANEMVAHLGDSHQPSWHNPLRSGPREDFIPGVFVQPHGACFDHDGNIFVAEWVEVGRVTKLRPVS